MFTVYAANYLNLDKDLYPFFKRQIPGNNANVWTQNPVKKIPTTKRLGVENFGSLSLKTPVRQPYRRVMLVESARTDKYRPKIHHSLSKTPQHLG